MNKPMIRHCYNCEWCIRMTGIDKCDVLYEYIHSNEGKKKARRCKYFTMKGANHEETETTD